MVSRADVLAWVVLLTSTCLAQELPSSPKLPPLIPEPIRHENRSLKLNIQEACRIALAKSPRAGLALAKIRQTQAEAEAAGAPLRPLARITLLGPPVPPGLAQLRQNVAFAPLRVEVRQLLLDGGKVAAQIDQLKAQADSNAHQAQAEWHQLHLEVSLAYLDVLRARAREVVSRESLELAKRQLQDTEKRWEAGDVPKGDVLLSRVPRAEAELELAKAGATARDKEEALNLLMGIPLDTPLILSEPDEVKPLGKDLPQCLAQAEQNRPTLRASRLVLRATEHGIKAAQADNRPTLTIVGGFFGISSDASAISSTGIQGGLELSWNFLDGGRSANLTRSAEAQRDQAMLRTAELERQLEGEVRQAYRAAELARVAQESSQVQLAQTQDAYRIATAQYQAGFVPFYPQRQAQLDMLRAKQIFSATLYDYIAARMRLDYVRGEEPDPSMPASKPLSDPPPEDEDVPAKAAPPAKKLDVQGPPEPPR